MFASTERAGGGCFPCIYSRYTSLLFMPVLIIQTLSLMLGKVLE